MYVRFEKGCTYRQVDVGGMTASVIREYDENSGTVVVDAGFFNPKYSGSKGRVMVPSRNHVAAATKDDFVYEITSAQVTELHESIEGTSNGETEEQAIERIRERFEILERLTEGIAQGCIRSLFVKGAPGVGKSFGVEKVLKEYSMISKTSGACSDSYGIVKGCTSPVALFVKLYEFSNDGQVIVFDDADSVFSNEDTLNMLKAVTDTSETRTVSYNTASRFLEDLGVPNQFEFNGKVIFITNLDPSNTMSPKIKPHVDALMDRSLTLDLTVHSTRDRFLRVKDVVQNSPMLKKFKLRNGQQNQIMDWLRKNYSRCKQGLSLRTVIACAELMSFSKDDAEFNRLATVTLLKGM